MTGSANNPWDISFMAMFHLSGDSHLFVDFAKEKGANGEWGGTKPLAIQS